ncbi:Maf family protein [Rhodospirillales bacterium]|nr:Maf family protein [Rhodospirillales bacterium]
MDSGVPPIILASKSRVRSRLLKQAGVAFHVRPPDVDEAVIKKQAGNVSTKKLARNLAESKARQVSADITDALVIGADQVLECQGVLFDKPVGQKAAREHLLKLRGKTHHLTSSVCVAQRGEIIWCQTDCADMTMLNFSNDFVEYYLEKAGDNIQASVGAYRLEDIGIQLFECIKGDYFTILGLPLLPLLGFLRTKNGVFK